MTEVSDSARELALRAAMLRRIEHAIRHLDAETLTEADLQTLVHSLRTAADSSRAARNRAKLAHPSTRATTPNDLQRGLDEFADRCAAAAAVIEHEAGEDVIAAAASDVAAELERRYGHREGADGLATILEFPRRT